MRDTGTCIRAWAHAYARVNAARRMVGVWEGAAGSEKRRGC